MRMPLLGAFTVLALDLLPARLPAGCHLEKYAELPVTMDGLRPLISGTINGVPARFLADSGGFYSLLWSDRINRLKLKATQVPGGMQIIGVRGGEYVHVATVQDFTLQGFGDGPVHKVQFLVAGKSDSPDDGLIGQNILGRADTEYDLANGLIRLYRATDCENYSLAYWHGTAPVSVMDIAYPTDTEPHIVGSARLNGVKIRVVFDTGATTSVLSQAAATRAGVGPGTTQRHHRIIPPSMGVGDYEVWVARFENLDLGGEQIKNAQLRVSSAALPTGDMLIGADFFLSHRVYVANSQHKIYFTYNGGPVFDLRDMEEPDAASTTTLARNTEAAPGNSGTGEVPRGVTDYKRRGMASAARGNLAGAIADFDAAILLDPTDAESYYQRALAKWRNNQAADARADLDQALKLNPQDGQMWLESAMMHLSASDDAAARTDFNAYQALKPGDANVEQEIIGLCMKYRRFEEAIRRLDQWMEKYPKSQGFSEALNTRCWARAKLGKDLELALADCNASLKTTADPAAVRDSRGLVWLRMGNYARAVDDYNWALRIYPKEGWSLYGRGLAELRAGRTEDGNGSIRAALKIDPGIADEFKEIGLAP